MKIYTRKIKKRPNDTFFFSLKYERQPENGITKKQKTKDKRESVSADLGSRGSSYIKDAVSFPSISFLVMKNNFILL